MAVPDSPWRGPVRWRNLPVVEAPIQNALRIRRVCVIFNPLAVGRQAVERQATLCRLLGDAGLGVDLLRTERRGHAMDLARRAAESNADAVVAAGGDGTVNEVVNGLLNAVPDAPPPLAILPLGTGNDFSDMVGVPRNLRAAVRAIARGAYRRVDVGRVGGRWFVNNAGMCMEARVTLENDRVRHLRGRWRYPVALLRVLGSLRAWQVRVDWAGGRFDGEAYLVSVCNSARNGGFFPMAPGARLDDGCFDLVIVPYVSRARVPALLAKLVRGVHVRDRRVIFVRSPRIQLRCDPGSPLHADGEVLGRQVRDVELVNWPRRLRVLVPAAVASAVADTGKS